MSLGIVMACVGEERRSATAKGDECGHGRNRSSPVSKETQ